MLDKQELEGGIIANSFYFFWSRLIYMITLLFFVIAGLFAFKYQKLKQNYDENNTESIKKSKNIAIFFTIIAIVSFCFGQISSTPTKNNESASVQQSTKKSSTSTSTTKNTKKSQESREKEIKKIYDRNGLELIKKIKELTKDTDIVYDEPELKSYTDESTKEEHRWYMVHFSQPQSQKSNSMYVHISDDENTQSVSISFNNNQQSAYTAGIELVTVLMAIGANKNELQNFVMESTKFVNDQVSIQGTDSPEINKDFYLNIQSTNKKITINYYFKDDICAYHIKSRD